MAPTGFEPSATVQCSTNRALGAVARFSKVPVSFRARKAIYEAGNCLFWKADLLTCFQGNKKKNYCKV